jgi:hypothetical protein
VLVQVIERARALPVVSTVAAVLLVIFGILIIIYPDLLGWIVGIGLILAGIAVLAYVLVPSDRTNPLSARRLAVSNQVSTRKWRTKLQEVRTRSRPTARRFRSLQVVRGRVQCAVQPLPMALPGAQGRSPSSLGRCHGLKTCPGRRRVHRVGGALGTP